MLVKESLHRSAAKHHYWIEYSIFISFRDISNSDYWIRFPLLNAIIYLLLNQSYRDRYKVKKQ